LLSPNATINPGFFNATLVFIHYCDGSSYTSFRQDPVPVPPSVAATVALELSLTTQNGSSSATAAVPTQLYFRGRANLAATTAWLLASEGMTGASDIVISGGSAGATGVYLGADAFRALVPSNIRVVANPDAGFFLDLPRASNASFYWYRECFHAADSVWGSIAAGTLSSKCLAAYATEPWLCYLAQYATPFIATPLYISNSAIDMWGLGNVLELGCIPSMTNTSVGIPGKPCTPAGWVELQGWWSSFQAALLPLLQRNPALGAWIVSCYVHEINVDYCSSQSLPNCRGWKTYKIGGETLSTAFPAWHAAALDNWAHTVQMFQNKAEEASRGGGSGGGGVIGDTLTSGQSVDPYTYPMNPSCIYPPG
jgi:hypothetical protein